eukprot:m.192484 g.192484  ORF g.192484 m.192484 type:complete len:425 (+) comp21742_c1_seq1:765-2039(+)
MTVPAFWTRTRTRTCCFERGGEGRRRKEGRKEEREREKPHLQHPRRWTMSGYHAAAFVFSLLGMLGSLTIMFVYWKMPQRRAYPAPIILMIAISDLALGTRFFVRSVAFLVNPDGPTDGVSLHIVHDDCLLSVLWMGLAETSSETWNALWCLNLIYDLKYPTRESRDFFKFFNLLVVLLSAGMTTLFLAEKHYGTVAYGGYVSCSLQGDTLSTASLAVEFILTVLCIGAAIVSLIYLYSRLRTISEEDGKRMLRNHTAYVMIFLFVWLFQRIVQFVGGHNLLHQVSIVLFQGQAFFVCIVRLTEPRILPSLLLLCGVSGDWVRKYWPSFTYADDDPLLERLTADEAGTPPVLPPPHTPKTELHTAEYTLNTSSARPGWGVDDAVRAGLQVSDMLGPRTASRREDSNSRREDSAQRHLPELAGDL